MKYYIQKMKQISVNDTEVLLAYWLKNDGDFVKTNETICEVESSKEVTEIKTNKNGYLFHLIDEGDYIQVQSPFAIISENENINIKKIKHEINKENSGDRKTEQKYTKKAELLAKKNNVDINKIIPSGNVIKVNDVIQYVNKNNSENKNIIDLADDKYDEDIEKILILGGGKSAIMISDIILNNPKQRIFGILDDKKSLKGKKIYGNDILGPISMIDKLWDNGEFDSAIISFSKPINMRAKLFEKLSKKGIRFTNIIDASVIIHRNVKIGIGNIIFANSRIGVCSTIGDNNFISSYVNIEHHNLLGSNCTFGPFFSSSGTVEIGDTVKFGIGVYIEPGLKIGTNSIISSGSVITTNIEYKTIVKKINNLKTTKNKL